MRWNIHLHLAEGEATRKAVFHVRLHLIPKFGKDGFGFVFPADYKKKTASAALDVISQEIRAHSWNKRDQQHWRMCEFQM